jgi:hypothetical protein
VRLASFNHDRYYGDVRHSWKLLDEFQTAPSARIDVAKDPIDHVFLEDDKSLGAIPRLQHFAQINARLVERTLHDLLHDRRIVEDESADGLKADSFCDQGNGQLFAPYTIALRHIGRP